MLEQHNKQLIKDHFSDIIKNWRKNSPRINDLSGNFSSIALGNAGKPKKTPLDDRDAHHLLQEDGQALQFYEACKKRFGQFGQHFISSVPYSLQEWCRLGSAVTHYLTKLGQEDNNRSTYFHSIGSAEGVVARTIAELGNGTIYTLTNSSTVENRAEFYKNAPATAFFFSGPYFDICPDMLNNAPDFQPFSKGFDIVFEDTCFQMHAPNRKEQIAWVCQNLREDGLFIAWEKCSLSNIEEYQRREHLKDTRFKARYFSNDQVAEKKSTILSRMEIGQVTLKELAEAISFTFKHSAVIWNSGNFYTVIASNRPERIEKFCSHMLPPCIPDDFNHLNLPATLHGPELNLEFRTARSKIS